MSIMAGQCGIDWDETVVVSSKLYECWIEPNQPLLICFVPN